VSLYFLISDCPGFQAGNFPEPVLSFLWIIPETFGTGYLFFFLYLFKLAFDVKDASSATAPALQAP
jgi:hypothetical protein